MSKITRHENFAKLYKKFALPLMKFLVKKMGGNWQDAEEVFSQTVLAAYQGFHTFEKKSKFFTWLCKIALNKAADYYRDQINDRSRFIAPTLDNLANVRDNTLSIEEKLILQELRSCIKQCLLLLPEKKRRLLYFRYWSELTIAEIAKIFGISERAVEGQIYRAKLALRQIVVGKFPHLQ